RRDPAFGPGAVDDGVLDRLDADGVVVDVEHAGGFAGRRADAAGEVREVVRAVQHVDGIAPVVLIDQIVEVRNDVVDRAAVVAKRRAAIHATRTLDLGLIGAQADDEFLVVLDALLDGLIALFQTFELQKASDFSHFSELLIARFRPWPWWTW